MIHLVDEKNKRLFYQLKHNIVGGPSIVSHRYHEKGVKKLNKVHYKQETKDWYYGDDGKHVHSIVGFDANALYLYCLGHDMLCGKLEWIPTEEEYKLEFESETTELKDDEKEAYKKDREPSKKGKELRKTLKEIMENNAWLSFFESFYGALEVDIEIPENKYETFGEMPPIFKNME